MPKLDDPLLIFTDVDGTLMDSHTGEWQAAAGWLSHLREHDIPVILCSSKTAAEMVALQKMLNLQGLPFIAENGAVVQLDEAWHEDENYPRLMNGAPHDEVARVLNTLRETHGWKFTSFSDLDESVLAEVTGLPPAQAARAKLQ